MSDFLTKKIVIVGAGISGVACAFSLKEMGFKNVRILEAQNRVGGRLKTFRQGIHHVEMGAQWIHGQKDNIIYDIAKSSNLIDDNAVSYMEKIESFEFLPVETRVIVRPFLEYLDQKLGNIPHDEIKNTNVLSYLKEEFNKVKPKFPQHEDFLEQVFNWFCKFLCELHGCIKLDFLSKTSFSAYKQCEGHQTVELKQGYQSVLDLFLQNIPQDWILKNTHVIKIDWFSHARASAFPNDPYDEVSEEKNIKIVCKNGKEYFADHVVVTVPLGYLKEHCYSLFRPNLSETKLSAIYGLGFGAVNKVFLYFESPFWEEYTVMNVLWSNELEEYFQKQSVSDTKIDWLLWIKDINRFAYTLTHPNMLCAWVVGEGARAVECLSDEKVMEDCLFLLEFVFKKQLPHPTYILRSSWASDPYTLGSYSYIGTRCDTKNVSNNDIAEPEYCNSPFPKTPVLLFAGEASHEKYFSTVHGACESGFREAKRLFQFYRNLHNSLYSDKMDLVSCGIAKLVSSKRNLREKVKIIVIGAGLAGLTCTSHLIKNNFTDILVLEAQNRIGGRIHSIKHGESFFELGAQWIHGTHNELYKYAERNGILPTVLDTSSLEGKGIFYTSSGKVVDSSLVDRVKYILDGVKSKLEKTDCHSKENKSVLSAFSDSFESYIATTNDRSNISMLRGVYDWYLRFELVDNACESLDTIATKSYAEWDDCDPDVYHIMTEKGYSSIVDSLVSQIPEGNIVLNKPVKTLKWLQNLKQIDFSESKLQDGKNLSVLVECEDGEIISADCVIVTASIGFLKENCHSFFDPPLPLNKLNALERFGFGTINKFYLVYENAFWHPDDLGIQLVWDKSLNEENLNLLNKNPWVRGIVGFDINKKLPNVLLGWIGGKEAEWSEEIEDDDFGLACTKLLKMFCHKSDIPNPVKVYRSKWYQNRFVRGAYSNRSLSFYNFDSTLDDLQYPLCSTYTTKEGLELQWPIVMLAGEALDQHAFSSAHGAYQNGLKSATSLIEAFSQIEISEEI